MERKVARSCALVYRLQGMRMSIYFAFLTAFLYIIDQSEGNVANLAKLYYFLAQKVLF
jgi:hypothetical protein